LVFCDLCYAEALTNRAQRKRERAIALDEEARKVLKKE
jgi:hypothetical protein